MKKHNVIITAIAVMALVACSALSGIQDGNSHAFDAGVKLATIKVIDGDLERRDRLIEIAEAVQAVVGDSDSATAALVDKAIRKQVHWDSLSPEETILVDEFIGYLVEEIRARINIGELDAEYKVAVAHVANLVIDSAGLVGSG